MIYAEKLEFTNQPKISIGTMFNGYEVTRIEVIHEEYPDHTEMLAIIYNNTKQIGKIWNMPVIITYK